MVYRFLRSPVLARRGRQRAQRMFPQTRFIHLLQHPHARGRAGVAAIQEPVTSAPAAVWQWLRPSAQRRASCQTRHDRPTSNLFNKPSVNEKKCLRRKPLTRETAAPSSPGRSDEVFAVCKNTRRSSLVEGQRASFVSECPRERPHFG